ncbi:Chaperonin 60 subunit alpha 2, chloroplastic [Senna tora]|uniref:Chaperonin 60 subunit alpha 2, chloroplastic n=1 Tax=Senna tora TaxID=362788 RepID=A0A834XCX0_9FABA|nr:Chaperonin 60 subunit alpha 2, chloroplastic [Senna tora]
MALPSFKEIYFTASSEYKPIQGAFTRAHLVTRQGSATPAFKRSSYTPVIALYPIRQSYVLVFWTTTSPSVPALVAIDFAATPPESFATLSDSFLDRSFSIKPTSTRVLIEAKQSINYPMHYCQLQLLFKCLSYKRNLNTFIPSSIITEVSDDAEDSIEITPSEPIFSIASAIKLPTYSSFPAEIEATATKKER